MTEGIDAKLIYQVIRDGAMIVFFAWMAISNRSRATRAEIDDVRKDHGARLTVQGERITVLEGAVKALPKHDDLQLLHTRISKVGHEVSETGKAVSAIAQAVKGLRSSVDRLNDHQLERSHR